MMKAAAWTAGVATLVQVVLVLAKVTGHVGWRWGFVLAPLELLAVLALATGVALVFAMAESLDGDDGLGGEEDPDA